MSLIRSWEIYLNANWSAAHRMQLPRTYRKGMKPILQEEAVNDPCYNEAVMKDVLTTRNMTMPEVHSCSAPGQIFDMTCKSHRNLILHNRCQKTVT